MFLLRIARKFVVSSVLNDVTAVLYIFLTCSCSLFQLTSVSFSIKCRIQSTIDRYHANLSGLSMHLSNIQQAYMLIN